MTEKQAEERLTHSMIVELVKQASTVIARFDALTEMIHSETVSRMAAVSNLAAIVIPSAIANHASQCMTVRKRDFVILMLLSGGVGGAISEGAFALVRTLF